MVLLGAEKVSELLNDGDDGDEDDEDGEDEGVGDEVAGVLLAGGVMLVLLAGAESAGDGALAGALAGVLTGALAGAFAGASAFAPPGCGLAAAPPFGSACAAGVGAALLSYVGEAVGSSAAGMPLFSSNLSCIFIPRLCFLP